MTPVMTPEEQARALTRDAWKVVDGLIAWPAASTQDWQPQQPGADTQKGRSQVL